MKQRVPDRVRVEPPSRWNPVDIRELRAYRELAYFLAWRDVKVRYKQTFLGVAWALMKPLATMVIFSIFFGRLAGVPSDGIPYPLFALAGLVPWQFFSEGLAASANSLVASANLISKVYFPRLVVPLAAVISGFVDLVVALLLLIVLAVYYEQPPGPQLALVPLFLLLALLSSLGAGLWLSALNVQFRDVAHVTPFFLQLLLFLTPIAYPTSLLPGAWRLLYAVNPMVGVVEGFRWAVVGEHSADWTLIGMSSISTAVLITTGLFFFRRMERVFADVV